MIEKLPHLKKKGKIEGYQMKRWSTKGFRL